MSQKMGLCSRNEGLPSRIAAEKPYLRIEHIRSRLKEIGEELNVIRVLVDGRAGRKIIQVDNGGLVRQAGADLPIRTLSKSTAIGQ